MSTLVRVMSRYLKKTKFGTSVEETARRLRQDRVGALLVEKNGEFIGLVTEKDVVEKAVAGGKAFAKTPVESIMTTPLNSIDTASSLLDALNMMAQLRVRHLVVREEERVVGIVTLRDLLVYFEWLHEQKRAPL